MMSCFEVYSILKICVPWSSKLHWKPTFTEVSRQSPVIIQNLMPASLIDLIVSLVRSWSLSSTAVAPNKVKSRSISEMTLEILSALWLMAALAYSYL